MTQSFDEWFEKNGELYREPTSDERFLFEAGAQSKQAEIDELQKRIDLALNELENIHFFRTENSDNAINILKGTTNEQ